MVDRRRKVLGLLCPRRPYIELFYVEKKVTITINNTWNIPFFHLQRTKNCQLTFLKKLFASNIEHKLHEKSDFINLTKY